MDSNYRPWQFHNHVLKLPTLAVSLIAGFKHFSAFGPQTADLGSFTAAFQPFAQSIMRDMFSNCRPWQFRGQFSAHWELWLSNCQPWLFYGRFSAPIKSGHETVDLGSFMARFLKLLTLAVSWPLFSPYQKCP